MVDGDPSLVALARLATDSGGPAAMSHLKETRAYPPPTFARPAATLLVAVLSSLPGAAHAASLTERLTESLSRGSAAAIVFALAAGLATALTPCVYPMIPITVSVFGARAGVPRSRALGLATVYVAGMATMYGLLGTGSALLGKAFGTFLASPWVIVPIAAIFTAMALSFFGAFELTLPMGLQNRLSRVGGTGFLGAFLMGVVSGFIAAPCTGPPLVAILTYIATTRDAARGFGLTFIYALGIGVPFWAVAGFSLSLPKSGRWMEAVKSVFGIVLLAFALYYLKNVAPVLWRLTGRSGTFLLGCAVAVAAGVALGAVHLSFHDRAGRRARKALGIALATLGLFAASNWLVTPKGELAWLRSESEALASARQTGRPVLIDFGASWCLPCKELEVLFARPEVAERLASGFTLLKVDCTNEDDDPAITALRTRYDAKGLPAVRIVGADGAVRARLDTAQIAPQELVAFLSSAAQP